MKKSASFTVAVVSLAAASLAACVNDHGNQSTTSSSSGASSGADRMTTQLKSSTGLKSEPPLWNSRTARNGDRGAGPNQVLSPWFPWTANSLGGRMRRDRRSSGGNFSSAGDVYRHRITLAIPPAVT